MEFSLIDTLLVFMAAILVNARHQPFGVSGSDPGILHEPWICQRRSGFCPFQEYGQHLIQELHRLRRLFPGIPSVGMGTHVRRRQSHSGNRTSLDPGFFRSVLL